MSPATGRNCMIGWPNWGSRASSRSKPRRPMFRGEQPAGRKPRRVKSMISSLPASLCRKPPEALAPSAWPNGTAKNFTIGARSEPVSMRKPCRDCLSRLEPLRSDAVQSGGNAEGDDPGAAGADRADPLRQPDRRQQCLPCGFQGIARRRTHRVVVRAKAADLGCRSGDDMGDQSRHAGSSESRGRRSSTLPSTTRL